MSVGAALRDHRLGILKSKGKPVTDRKEAVAIGRAKEHAEKNTYGSRTGADAAAALAARKKE